MEYPARRAKPPTDVPVACELRRAVLPLHFEFNSVDPSGSFELGEADHKFLAVRFGEKVSAPFAYDLFTAVSIVIAGGRNRSRADIPPFFQ